MRIKLLLISLLFIVTSNFVAFATDGIEDDKHRKALLQGKINNTQEVIEVGKGWYDARLITPGTQVYLKDKDGFKLHKGASDPIALHLYKQSPNLDDSKSRSQGLLKTATRSLGVSVDTSIHAQTQRKKEKKQTHVQYDKDHIQQNGKDFTVDVTRVNSKNVLTNKTNYDGGHLVDHKFSTQGSHTDNPNYVPQHHYYNSWLKEYIVKDTSGYLEIPLFTSNPPLIKVMDQNKYDPIPIGIVLVPLMNSQIQDMYYFPNNQYNYRTFQINQNIKKDMAQSMIANFKLKKAFHQLLWPAIIHDIRARDANFAHQLAQEAKGMGVMGDLIEGMSVLNLDEEEAVISTLASDVMHQSNVKISNILDVSKNKIAAMNRGQPNQGALSQSFNALGQFLMDYAMKNALKSEVVSTHSRIMFANIVTDFIENYYQVGENAMNRIDALYTDIYKDTLDELWNIKDRMNLRDLIYFANLHEKLSSMDIEAAFHQGFDICDDMELQENIPDFIDVLRLLMKKVKIEKPNTKQMQNLTDLFIKAQIGLSYMIESGYPSEDLRDEKSFLKEAKKRVKGWNNLSDSTSGEYQASPNSGTMFRRIAGYNSWQIEYLGTTRSGVFPNAEDDSEEDSDDSIEGEDDYENEE